MHALWILLTLILAGEVLPRKVCRYQDVLDHLNLTKKNEVFTTARPVWDWRRPTVAHLDLYLYAILAVMEKSQIFTPLVWFSMNWHNEFISWDPSQFCGISKVSIPKEMLWKPDLVVFENTADEDDSPKNPFLYVSHDGTVHLDEGLRVVGTCKMDLHKFPFDTQSCTITVGSFVHSVDDLLLRSSSNSSHITQGSREIMLTQGEWDFLHMTVVRHQASINQGHWDELKYKVTIKRRPLLYVVNFLVPIAFFLTLDIASFFISDTKGEKLGFKVTVLLSVSVLLLILNDILPSTSDRTPLIAIYCIVIFAFMWMSILETIMVAYLMERALAPGSQVDEECILMSDNMEAPHVSAAVLPSDSEVLQQILVELQALQWSLLPRAQGSVEQKPQPWERNARRIDVAFFCCYLVTIILFHGFLFVEWMA